ncbi:MAG: hypothetical protein RQ801_12580 [Spirochaetaceae bacterium]|nr:hypothetical protein [Spirochaetaceae bacterium]MDT8299135.1 hypothetical protein [Spirochaetaceae bacterium]
MKRLLKPSHTAAVILCLFISVHLGGQEVSVLPQAAEFAAKLGWTPDEAFGWLGPPDALFPYRGEVPSEDNVVFYYDDHTYLFWFSDRVWQVRADENWPGEVDGVRMGMSLAAVRDIWGAPVNDRDENPTWVLPDRGYPVRIRLYFDDSGGLHDLYVYRSDW